MDEVITAYQKTAINLLRDPDCAEDLSNQFTLLVSRGDAGAAYLPLARRCAALAPNTFIAVFNQGSAELKAGLYREGIKSFTRALPLADPANVRVTMQHIGLACYASGDVERALKWYERARGIKDDTEIQQSIAIARLMAGELEAMFEFECKHHTPRRKPIVSSGIPRWMGEDLTSKTIIVCHEQGFGDTIQFARFIPKLKAERVIWSGPESLRLLMAENFSFSEMIGEDGPFEADYYCSPISICGALRSKYNSVSGLPCLKARPIKLPDRGLKIGLCWAGNPDYAHDAERSMSLKDMSPLLEIPGTGFYSFQVGANEADIPRLGLDGLVANLGGTLKNWHDTARAVQAMDLIVSVDSGVAHIAGALGKPVLILLPYANCWRWMRDRADTPWYSSVKLFRQSSPGQWAEPVSGVRDAILEILNGRRAEAA